MSISDAMQALEAKINALEEEIAALKAEKSTQVSVPGCHGCCCHHGCMNWHYYQYPITTYPMTVTTSLPAASWTQSST